MVPLESPHFFPASQLPASIWKETIILNESGIQMSSVKHLVENQLHQHKYALSCSPPPPLLSVMGVLKACFARFFPPQRVFTALQCWLLLKCTPQTTYLVVSFLIIIFMILQVPKRDFSLRESADSGKFTAIYYWGWDGVEWKYHNWRRKGWGGGASESISSQSPLLSNL